MTCPCQRLACRPSKSPWLSLPQRTLDAQKTNATVAGGPQNDVDRAPCCSGKLDCARLWALGTSVDGPPHRHVWMPYRVSILRPSHGSRRQSQNMHRASDVRADVRGVDGICVTMTGSSNCTLKTRSVGQKRCYVDAMTSRHSSSGSTAALRDRGIPASEVKERLQGCICIRPWLRTPVL